MSKPIRGLIAKCNEKISNELYQYEILKELQPPPSYAQEYAVLFLPNNLLTKTIYFRYDAEAMVVINYKSGFLSNKPTNEPVPENAPEQLFNENANVFIRNGVGGKIWHKMFLQFNDNDVPQPNDGSSFHTFNYIPF